MCLAMETPQPQSNYWSDNKVQTAMKKKKMISTVSPVHTSKITRNSNCNLHEALLEFRRQISGKVSYMH